MFESLVILGTVGLALMVLLGFAHGHGTGHAGHSGHGGLGHGHGGALGHGGHGGHAGHIGHAGHGVNAGHGSTHANHGEIVQSEGDLPGTVVIASHPSALAGAARSYLLGFISPLDLFSVIMGTGMAGILIEAYTHVTSPWPYAIAAGLLFDAAFTRTLMHFVVNRVAEPSAGLEGLVAHVVRATTAFDADGHGIVEILLDGMNSQVLATLERGELQAGVRVHKGDALVILEVDAQRNRCTVSKDVAPEPQP